MAKDVLGKTVRIDDKTYDPKGAKLEIWTKGRHKYVIHHLDKKGIQPSSLTYYYIDGDKISASLTDDEVIKGWLSQIETSQKKVYKVIQDPYSDEPVTKRVYGDGKSFYYLNNGCSISIEWRGDKPNPDFTLGTFSNPDDAERYYRKKDTNGVRNGPDRYLKDTVENPVILTSSVDDANDKSKLPTSSWVVEEPFDNGIAGISVEMTEPNYRDKSSVDNKVVTVNMPTGFTENDGKGYLVWTNHGLQYNTKALPHGTEYSRTLLIDTQGNVVDPGSTTSTTGLRAVEAVTQGDIITHFARGTKDSNIVSEVIEKFKSMVVALHGISRSDYDLKLCEPDSEACKLIEYKSPLEPSNNTPQQAAINDIPPGPSQSSTKIKLNIQGLFGTDGTTPGSTSSVFEIKAKTDMPTFIIWTGEIPQSEEIDVFDDLQELDDEYREGVYSGEEEKNAELESPSSLGDPSSESSFVTDTSTTSSYTPDPNAKPGTVVQLPKDYSHTSEQGYNLLNSQWIGDLIASAKSHIGHPTYDISGTDKGNLGCASAVSMMFYRAFGVHMKDGKAVKAKPTDIGSFGTKGTGEAAGWFANTSLYQKIPWQEAQPGDIMNTARREPKAGHIGVVIDVKAKDGSWAIVSNSSKGFAGGGGGAVKQNYSVKAWQSVTDRNPSGTFAFRYIGPRLSPGQTA